MYIMTPWEESLLISPTGGPPSLGQSDDSGVNSISSPATPADMSPYMKAGVYSIPQIDAMALPKLLDTPRLASHDALPDILDPSTAANTPTRHICCIGAGYVGGPTAAVLALHNPHVRVTVIDRDEDRIRAWRSKHLPVHESGLGEVVRLARDGSKQPHPENQAQGGAAQRTTQAPDSDLDIFRRPNLFFSTACAETIADADIILISVNTPTKAHGVGAERATDLAAVEGAVRDVAMHAKPGTILVEKSTVPCKTGQLIKDILEAYRPGVVFPILSNPEFLSEGTTVRDLLQPDRVIIGCESTILGHRAAAALANLYAAWVSRSKIAPINIWSSELCKLAANAMLAQRISSINSISAICERTGADISEIAQSVGMDARIGPQFLKAGLGFGGSCFRKDIASLTYLAESLGLPEVAAYWQQVLTMNNFQRDRFARNVISSLNNTLRGKKITILGYAFKKNTGDARESPTLDVIRILIQEKPKAIAIYDPLCSESDIKRDLRVLNGGHSIMQPHGPVEILPDPYAACTDSNAILVLTDWDIFKNRKPTELSKPSDLELAQLDGAAPTNIVRLPHHDRQFGKPTSPKPTPTGIHFDGLVPEPECQPPCEECSSSRHAPEKAYVNMPLDWDRISSTVKEPRWVFDGRGVLDPRAMVALGFRLETLGRASMY